MLSSLLGFFLSWIILVVSCLRTLPHNVLKTFPVCCHLRVFIVLHLKCDFWVNFCISCEVWVKVHLCEYTIAPGSSARNTNCASIELFLPLCQKSVPVFTLVLFLDSLFWSIDLCICFVNNTPIQHSLCYSTYIMS
jgi:hypothetical protein